MFCAEIDGIKKGEPVKRIRIASNKRGYKYEITSNKPLRLIGPNSYD
ncbi:MAG TPA: hypothetical protein VFG90_09485 [Nitrososphaeraceae archaeon]|nr:hypothetical protein [Nitrososphaeraceae archaeon]